MTIIELVQYRLANQQLSRARLNTPDEVAASMVGVQAQDYSAAKWSIGLRMPGGTEAGVDRAIQDKKIIRTWAMRGTLHFVAASDIHWLMGLLAPGNLAGNARRYRQLELDWKTLNQSSTILEKALQDGKQLTRKELVKALEQAGISAEGQRAPYILQYAALHGLLCQGPLMGGEPTYVLLEEWAPMREILAQDEALVELIRRYFVSYGPATLQDLMGWSGLSSAQVKAGLESLQPQLVKEMVGQQTYWMNGDSAKRDLGTMEAYLLPPFDSYLLGYKDRSAMLAQTYAKKVNLGGGMPKPTVIIDGQVMGTWSFKIKKMNGNSLDVSLFTVLDEGQQKLLHAAAQRFGEFLNIPISTLNIPGLQ